MKDRLFMKLSNKKIIRETLVLLVCLFSISCTTLTNYNQNNQNIIFIFFNDLHSPNFIDNDISKLFSEHKDFKLVNQGKYTKENGNYSLTFQYYPTQNGEVNLFNIKIIEARIEGSIPPGYRDLTDFSGRKSIWEVLIASGFHHCGSFSVLDYSTHYYQNKNWNLLLILKRDDIEIFIEKKSTESSKLAEILQLGN